MKQKLTIIKNIFSLLLIGGLSLIMLILGIGMLIENQTLNISETIQTSGTIKRTQIVREKSKVGAFPFTKMIEQDHLMIELESTDLFGTFNPNQKYSKIQSELSPGRKVKIYSYNSSNPTPTNNIYQLESDGQIIINPKDFVKNHSIAAMAIIGFGLFCLGIGIWLLKTKKIDRNWAQQRTELKNK